ncbi:MAG: geranylgeranylglycerol-phosphate geranylgeranyltransferase [Flavobacteriales bacterium]|jgi:4-hydroxybenzoate polyprenyltransferase|nr:MAG: geranylgeranylglycerol-phosphate geranylgeranyltransferase [Flavobacteriales bacterium]
MIDLLRLARPLNLLIIALTMALIRYGLVLGYLERGLHQFLRESGTGLERADLQLAPGFGPQLPLPFFLLLVASVVLIAAAGNIINDYFDTRIDRINKPGQVIVGRSVKRRVAMAAHLALSGAGLLCGAIVAWRTGQWPLLIIPAFAIGALWWYSTSFKRQLIIGNGTVATLTALVPLTAGLYEIPALQRSFAAHSVIALPDGSRFRMEGGFLELWHWVLGFAAFAFIASLVRELQKDMADVKGDEAEGCRTIPIAWGMRWAKAIALVHIGILIVALLLIRMWFLRDPLSYWYIGIGIIGPLLLSAGFTYNAATRAEHLRAGNLMKAAMVTGAGFAALVRFLP